MDGGILELRLYAPRETLDLLANGPRRMQQGPLARLEKEINRLSVRVARPEARLQTRGGEPDRIEALSRVRVARPMLATAYALMSGLLQRLWYFVADPGRKG